MTGFSEYLRLLSVVCLLSSCTPFLFAQHTEDKPLQEILKYKVIKSPSQRFTILSSDARESLVLMNWAEEIAGKVERAIGIKLPFNGWVLRIVVRPPSADLTDAQSSFAENSGSVMATQELVNGQLIQRLVIYNYKNANREDAQQALCSLLLNGYVIARGTEAGRQTTDNGQRTTDFCIPYWLSQGMAQNLYPELKARNSEMVLSKWQDGQLMPLAQFLRSEGTEGRDKAVCGLLFGWLKSLPNSTECFEKFFKRLAAGETISPEWFITCIPACGSIADLEEQWDNWILRQKRIIYRPGIVTSQLIDELKAQLLLYPGDFGIPLTSNLCQRIEFRDLIGQREASWIPVFSRNKGASLRLLAVGRGEEFGEVIESYWCFLDALGKRKSKRKLEMLLNKANVELEELGKKVNGKKQD